MKRRLLLASLLPVVALSACGSGGDDVTAEIDAAIHAAALIHSPTRCGVIATQRFLEQVSGQTGVAAFHTCEEEAEDPTNKAKSVTVSKITVDGTRATASVTFAGLPVLGHETVDVALVDEDYGWTLDAVRGFGSEGKPRPARSVGSYPLLTAEERSCADHIADRTSPREDEERMLAAGFSGARYSDGRAACEGTGATEVAPPGASYAFPVPHGFQATTPNKEDKGFLVFLFAPPTRHTGAGIDVHEVHLGPELGRATDRSDFRLMRKGFEESVQEDERETGATESAVESIRVHGHPALRWVVANGKSKPFPGTDEETTAIFSTSGTGSVWVECTWGRDQAESQLIQRGCGAVIRSLRSD